MKQYLKIATHHRRFRLSLMIVTIFVSLAFFEEVVDDVFHDPLEGDTEVVTFDNAISSWVQSFRSDRLTQVMVDLTALGSVSVIVTVFFILLSVLASYRDFRGLIYLVAVLIGSAVWPLLLKLYFGRSRPAETEHLVTVSDLSFPSGHAFGATAVYIALGFYLAKYAKSWAQELFFYVLCFFVILFVSISRIYLGVHYPTDILAGVSGGVVWALLISAIYEYLYPISPSSRAIASSENQ